MSITIAIGQNLHHKVWFPFWQPTGNTNIAARYISLEFGKWVHPGAIHGSVVILHTELELVDLKSFPRESV